MSWHKVITTKGRLLDAEVSHKEKYVSIAAAVRPGEYAAILIDTANKTAWPLAIADGEEKPDEFYQALAQRHGYVLGFKEQASFIDKIQGFLESSKN